VTDALCKKTGDDLITITAGRYSQRPGGMWPKSEQLWLCRRDYGPRYVIASTQGGFLSLDF
jgi:hypothetical protein